MFVTEQNGTQMWTKMLKENFNVTDQEKLSWVSEYATIHQIKESAQASGAQLGSNNLFATPLNTTGMGNPMAPGYNGDGQVAMGGSSDFFKQTVGSGDMPVSTLPMALNVALLTIGLELVPVIPAKGPWAMLTYMDFPYAGGKLGRGNEVAAIDGKGVNHPLVIKVTGKDANDSTVAAALVASAFKTTYGVTLTKLQQGRMDGNPIYRVSEDALSSDYTIRTAVKAAAVAAKSNADVDVDFAQTSVDFVDGYANFAGFGDGKVGPMSRAENETGIGNTIGLRLFSKWIQMGSYEVTGTVTRQQLQDLPLYGVDAVSKVMEALQNEITQSINARILEHVFALGTTNAVNQKAFQHVDLNLWMGKSDSTMATVDPHGKMKDIYGNTVSREQVVKNSEVNTSAENLHTRQRRISSRVLAAANLIQTVGRRGRATWVVTNAQIATALQDCSGYVVAPMVNGMAQDGSQNLFLGGTLAGLKVYVDPYMDWDDCRICVGRKGDGNSPGVVFMPYILADTVSITAEGTMAPKMLVNSRYAIADAGFYPETQYYTFCVGSEFGLI